MGPLYLQNVALNDGCTTFITQYSAVSGETTVWATQCHYERHTPFQIVSWCHDCEFVQLHIDEDT